MIVKKFDKNDVDKNLKGDVTSKRIFNIQILDGSGSMFMGIWNNPENTKYAVAYKGLQEELKLTKDLTNNYENITDTIFGIFEFSGNHTEWLTYGSISTVRLRTMTRTSGESTPLYKSICEVIDYIISQKNPEDMVILKILTDGQDTGGGLAKAAYAIKDAEENHNFTVTFVGTKNDVNYIKNNLNIDASNTFVHQNTSDSIKMSMQNTANEMNSYYGGVNIGADVSRGFYDKSTV